MPIGPREAGDRPDRRAQAQTCRTAYCTALRKAPPDTPNSFARPPGLAVSSGRQAAGIENTGIQIALMPGAGNISEGIFRGVFPRSSK